MAPRRGPRTTPAPETDPADDSAPAAVASAPAPAPGPLVPPPLAAPPPAVNASPSLYDWLKAAVDSRYSGTPTLATPADMAPLLNHAGGALVVEAFPPVVSGEQRGYYATDLGITTLPTLAGVPAPAPTPVYVPESAPAAAGPLPTKIGAFQVSTSIPIPTAPPPPPRTRTVIDLDSLPVGGSLFLSADDNGGKSPMSRLRAMAATANKRHEKNGSATRFEVWPVEEVQNGRTVTGGRIFRIR